MEPRVISTDSEHDAALAELDRLILSDPKRGTPEAQRLELLSVLVEAYERDRFRIANPTPVEAIRFRMKQQGLTQRDLVPFIGSKSKVSEVLAEKAPLSLRMIRRLTEGLGIPAEVLVQEAELDGDQESIDWGKFPVREMARRGWLHATNTQLRKNTAQIVQDFFAALGPRLPASVFCRRSIHERTSGESDRYALLAWIAQLILAARTLPDLVSYKEGTVDDEFLKAVVQLSRYTDGPIRAQKFLAQHGIALIVLQQLPRTKLDGASTLSEAGNPVIGITLRHDRIDSFWFTVLHELVHIARHLSSPDKAFIDDLDVPDTSDPVEREADALAREVCVPRSLLRRDDAYLRRTPESVITLANRLSIHPAIVAGRVRRETNNYRILSQLVGHRQVRTLFPEREAM